MPAANLIEFYEFACFPEADDGAQIIHNAILVTSVTNNSATDARSREYLRITANAAMDADIHVDNNSPFSPVHVQRNKKNNAFARIARCEKKKRRKEEDRRQELKPETPLREIQFQE